MILWTTTKSNASVSTKVNIDIHTHTHIYIYVGKEKERVFADYGCCGPLSILLRWWSTLFFSEVVVHLFFVRWWSTLYKYMFVGMFDNGVFLFFGGEGQPCLVAVSW